jgi:P pilus assembly chaperone PapD
MTRILTFIFILFGLQANISNAVAQGNLIVIPRRVVFDESKRTQELSIANIGTDTAKYLISVIQYRMTKEGAFENIIQPDSGQNFADKNFRFFPRSVVLGPNETQTIKLQLINTGDLQTGEYRSHLYFRAVPVETPYELADTNQKVISVRLVPVFGLAIPVIIRKGISTNSIAIVKAALESRGPNDYQVTMTFSRSGNMSVYGDIKVEHISAQGKIIQVGQAKGFAVYTPNDERNFRINLDRNPNIDYRTGKIHIVYSTSSEIKYAVIAEKELDLH